MKFINTTKGSCSEEFTKEYNKISNKVTYDAKMENVTDMTERITNLKKLAVVLSKVTFINLRI